MSLIWKLQKTCYGKVGDRYNGLVFGKLRVRKVAFRLKNVSNTYLSNQYLNIFALNARFSCIVTHMVLSVCLTAGQEEGSQPVDKPNIFTLSILE